eukprot:s1908_g14.t2
MNDIVTPVAFRKKMMDLGFESISTRPKAKAKSIRRDSGHSSFELVTDPASASGQETVKQETLKPEVKAEEKAAEDVLGGTTLSSEGGSLTSSSVASGQVPEPKHPPAHSRSPGKRKEHAESDTEEFQILQDELDTKEKRAVWSLLGSARFAACTATLPIQRCSLQATHKKIEDYFNHVSQRKNQAEHISCMNARKDWIKQQNEGGPDCKRLQSKKALMEARKTLNVARNLGGRFIAPKKKFVEKDNWNEAEHGTFDPTKVVSEYIFGKEVQGCWILKGKRGEYDFEEYQDTALQENEQVHNSADAPFSEEALGRKRKAMMEEFTESSRARDKASVKGQELSMEALLAAIQAGQSRHTDQTLERDLFYFADFGDFLHAVTALFQGAPAEPIRPRAFGTLGESFAGPPAKRAKGFREESCSTNMDGQTHDLCR